MNLMEKTILYGNGVNLLGCGPSWNTLLQKISNKSLLPPIQSNTLKYEYIILPQDENKKIYLKDDDLNFLCDEEGNRMVFDINRESEIKENLCQELEKQKPSYFYDLLVELNADNYITTNYELFLPKMLLATNPDTKNPLYRCRISKKYGQHKTFWNIHGNTENPDSVILGLSDYCQNVVQIDNYLKQPKGQKCWIDLFFNTDIHILGLAMGYEEIDIWNVLTSRKRKRRKNTEECKNSIYYYAIQDDSFDSGKKELLKALDVNVVDIEFDWSNNAYKKAYEKIFNNIKMR